MQDQIARDVAANLRLRLTGQEEQRLTKRDTEDPEAYLLFREGMYHWHKFTEEGLKTAIEYFERAKTKDSSYAPAHEGLGRCYNVLGVNYWSPKETLPKAREHLEMALKLDPSLADAHADLGLLAMVHDRNWSAAEREFQLALQLNRQSPDAHNLFAIYLTAMRRLPEAIAENKQALLLDPQVPIRSSGLAETYVYARQYDQAIAQCQKTFELDPQNPFTFCFMGMAYAYQGKYEAAVAELQKANAIIKDYPTFLGVLGYTYARWGKRDEAEKLLQKLSDLAQGDRFVFGLDLAMATIHAGLGNIDQALQCLRKAQDAGEPWLIYLNVDPTMDNLRSDPRFDALLRDMGLADKPTPTRSASDGTPTQARSASDGPGPPIDTLAVLPFVYQSGDADAEFLAEGIPQSVSTSLAQIRTLKVRPQSSVSRFKEQAAADLFAVGRALQVQALVTGNIQKRGERLFVTWQLADVRSNSILDGANYSRELADLFQLQEDLAKEIAGKLRLKLTGEEQRQLARRPTENLETFRLYTLGQHHWNQYTEEGLTKAISYFEQALVQDAKFALAHIWLARSYNVLAINYWPPKETFAKAKSEIDAALKLDPSLIEAHAELGILNLFSERDWAAAEREFKLALQLDPQSHANHHFYALYLQVMGRLDEAITELQQAKDLNPTAAVVMEDLAWAHIYSHQYDRAIAHSQRVLELDRDFFFAFASIGLAYAQQRKYQEAIDTFGKMPTSGKNNPESLGLRGYIYARWGKHEEARQGIAELQDLATRRFAPGHEQAIARIYAGLEDKDRAFHWLSKAYEAGWPWLVVLKIDPTFDNLRFDPRFEKIIADMKLPP